MSCHLVCDDAAQDYRKLLLACVPYKDSRSASIVGSLVCDNAWVIFPFPGFCEANVSIEKVSIEILARIEGMCMCMKACASAYI